MKTASLTLAIAIGILLSCSRSEQSQVASPSGKIMVHVFTTGSGQVAYTVTYDSKNVIDTSTLGFEFTDLSPIDQNLTITDVQKRRFDETWELPWGEQRFVRNHFNELTVRCREKSQPNRKMNIVFRVFDDGLGFRYEFPEQENLQHVFIAEENTRFSLAGNHLCWWTPGDWDITEHLNNTTLFSEIDALSKRNHPNLAQTYIPVNAVNTPVTMKTAEGLYLSFHEAALINYAGITLEVDTLNLRMRSNLVGSESTQHKVKQTTPFTTPWRTIQIAEKAGDLIESKLILNLNEPNRLGDVSWLKPTKYVGIWWEMHLGKSTWNFVSGKHGASTENAKRYIDFAAESNIGALLVEGWNTGWENWIGTASREGIFDFVTPYPDYNLKEVVAYARSKNVRLIMHHETSSAVSTYDMQLDTAFALMKHHGIDMVKTGYVGTILPVGEYHHGQWMVNHYMRVLEKAAQNKVAVNSHEPITDTGLRRTYPNDFSREGLRGQEFNAWATDGGNPPEHIPTVAFTQMLAGPIDYTPGIFNIKLKPYKLDNQVNTTLAHQLALYVVLYSPLQMAADLPENYKNHPAFQFIKDVGVNWEQTRVMNGEVGMFVTIAREERNTGSWFLGSITNSQARQLSVKTDFLTPGLTYNAIVYEDGENAHWDKNPTAYNIKTLQCDHTSELVLHLAPGGGTAISFTPTRK